MQRTYHPYPPQMRQVENETAYAQTKIIRMAEEKGRQEAWGGVEGTDI